MSFTWGRGEAYALKFCPFPSAKVERPGVVIVVLAICTAEAVQEGISDEGGEGGNEKIAYTMICSSYVTQMWPVRWAGLSGEAGSQSSQADFVFTMRRSEEGKDGDKEKETYENGDQRSIDR